MDLNADAVPLAAEGLDDIIPYDESVGLPAVFTYNNGESFPYGAWSNDNTILVEVDGQNVQVDAVVIEGCNDAQFTVWCVQKSRLTFWTRFSLDSMGPLSLVWTTTSHSTR